MDENKPIQAWRIYTDGAIDPKQGISGLAAIVRAETGEIRYWWNRRVGRLTCNEAEYAAVIFALEKLLELPSGLVPTQLLICSDSQVVVNQMNGAAAAHSPAMNKARNHLRRLVTRFQRVEFQHIFREQNRLADALAYEAIASQKIPQRAKRAAVGAAGQELLESWGLK